MNAKVSSQFFAMIVALCIDAPVCSFGSDGAFRIVPLLRGQYRLRAMKPGYRSAERLVNVPDATPLTLVLLFEPD